MTTHPPRSAWCLCDGAATILDVIPGSGFGLTKLQGDVMDTGQQLVGVYRYTKRQAEHYWPA
ncbi:hypothetical protein [Paraburkholderia saeva]|uniref:Uncharacterized protein n=1 Tax=Paraburkholderia saeva TaxID=2777537 RepID=A0A9N8RSB1_9BURK|nr:hypothetical protein [Paraburkholderia saeva]CAG4886978.1 hypothetical protein R70241_00303 [Paraburkholderia saeva]CAG4887013.1 hypothetical protein LMG31841_00315 [Paraburkholderia saeva]